MKVDMILVFAIVVGLVAVPYALLILLGSGDTKKIASFIKGEASKSNLKIDHQEKWSSRQIALDTTSNVVLFGQILNKKLHVEKIDLATISRVLIQEHKETKRIDGKVNTTLEKLSLEFFSKESNTPVILNFYDSEIDASQNYEMNRITNWKELIENQLNTNVKQAKAA